MAAAVAVHVLVAGAVILLARSRPAPVVVHPPPPTYPSPPGAREAIETVAGGRSGRPRPDMDKHPTRPEPPVEQARDVPTTIPAETTSEPSPHAAIGPSDGTDPGDSTGQGRGGDDGPGTGQEGIGPGSGPGGTAGPAAPSREVRTIGSDVVPPELVHRVEPDYPRVAQRAGVSGEVVLSCIVGEDGSVRVHRVLRDIPLLTDAAIDAVEQWRYRPAQWQGAPQSVYLTVRLRFALSR